MLTLTRWPGTPWSIFDEFEPVNRALNQAGCQGGAGGRHTWSSRSSYPLVNVWQSGDDLIIDAEIPGVDPADADVSVKGNELTLSGKMKQRDESEQESFLRRERASGDFLRRLELPFKVESEAVTANYKNGLLRIYLPRAEADKPRKVAIEAS